MSEVHSEADITHRRSGGFIHAIIICPIAILHTHPFHDGKWVSGGFVAVKAALFFKEMIDVAKFAVSLSCSCGTYLLCHALTTIRFSGGERRTTHPDGR
jgi:hypothetical protein